MQMDVVHDGSMKSINIPMFVVVCFLSVVVLATLFTQTKTSKLMESINQPSEPQVLEGPVRQRALASVFQIRI